MNENANQKIGNLIAQIRQERGLTQAEFAQQLSTSQSAVNRIEHGKQNLTLETLAHISEVLDKQLISLGGRSLNLRIEGGHELHGEITLKTSKNAAVALLCASLLNYGVTRFTSFPRIEEVYRIIEVLESIGVKVKWGEGNSLEIRRPEKLKLDEMDAEAARKTRTVLMMLGPLMHDYKEFKIPYAGGCKLGARTVAPHLYALEEFGLNVVAQQGHYEVTVKKKPAGRVVLYEAGDTVTENALFAAARTAGETIIEFGTTNYMVQDVAFFLQRLGVKVEFGRGTSIKVTGVPKIKKNVTYSPAEDPIEAMFFTAAAITTNSKITIKRVPISFMSLELLKLKKMGLKYDSTAKIVRAYGKKYPGFRLRLVDRHKRAGKSGGLNYCLQKYVKSDLVMTLDADCVIMPDTIERAVAYFDDPLVAGVAANVRLMNERSVLGILQQFEHLIGYRSKKFYTLTNCEIIVGGVASTYRREVLQEVGNYNNDTQTEDIGLSMAIAALGNKSHRLVYASDVVAMTEGAHSYRALLRQRYRWKMGCLQNLLMYTRMTLIVSRRHSLSLTMYRLPMAFLSEVMLLLQPLILGYVIWLSIHYHATGLFVGAYLTITIYVLLTIWPDEHSSWAKKLSSSLYAPFMYFIFYIMETIQVVSIVRCLFNPKTIARKAGTQQSAWTPPARSGQEVGF